LQNEVSTCKERSTMRRAVPTLALASLTILSTASAADALPDAQRGRVASLYVQRAQSEHLLVQANLAPGTRADRAEIVVMHPGDTHKTLIARVPAELALAAGDEVEFHPDPDAGLGTRAHPAPFKITRVLTQRSQSVAAQAAQLAVVTEDGRLFIRNVGSAASTMTLAGKDARIANLVLAGPARSPLARVPAGRY
jgi:hypothetical protein